MQSNGNNLFLGFFSLALVIVLALMGCGGGSAGTGTGAGPVVVVQGAVLDTSGQPLEDFRVRVLETGNEATTSQTGEFELVTEPESSSVTLEISSPSGSVFTTLDIPQDGGTVAVKLVVNPRLSQVDANSLEVAAGIVGRCDIYFENGRVIRQANSVPDELTCVAKVIVSAGGRRLGRVPFAVQYRGCDESSPWVTIAAENTLTPPNRGVGQAQFTFIDDEQHCLYRIVAPFGVSGLPELEKLVYTRTYQSRD